MGWLQCNNIQFGVYTVYKRWTLLYGATLPSPHSDTLIYKSQEGDTDRSLLTMFHVQWQVSAILTRNCYQLFEARLWQCTIVGSCNTPELSAGLEAFNCPNAASVSGNAGGVAGVFVGTQLYRKRQKVLLTPLWKPMINKAPISKT